MPRATNFTEAQKAELYVLHRAICVYSGEKLWILDGGATPYFTIDWADHVYPVSKGGLSTVENGVCASWFHNIRKRDSIEQPIFLFYKGEPTKHYLNEHQRVPIKMQRDLLRLAALHHSDWYFNRAVFRLLLGVDYLDNGKNVRKRDDLYYASAALKAIKKWRTITKRENVPSLEERRLAPKKPSDDKQIIMAIRDADSVPAIRTMMKKLLPIYAASY